MKKKLLIIAMLPLLLWGCDMNDLFDEGEIYKTYDGPDVVGFAPLQQERSLAQGTATVEIQLITSTSNTSDRPIAFSTGGTAQAGVHYNLVTSSPATIGSGNYSVSVQIQLIEGSLESGQTVRLELNLEGGGGASPSENLKQAEIFING